MAGSTSISARPALTPCTCVWPALLLHRRRIAEQAESIENRYETLSSPLDALAKIPDALGIPGAFGGRTAAQEEVAKLEVAGAAELEAPPHSAGSTVGKPTDAHSQLGGIRPVSRQRLELQKRETNDDVRLEKKRAALGTKGMANVKRPDVVIRALKKKVSRSSENKTRSLFSYREDIVGTLSVLIPAYTYPEETFLDTFPTVTLCHSCLTTLAYSLYYSPARFEPYLAESSTRAYLALLDDAVASLASDGGALEMEGITHRELERILKGEAAVVEWRIATKLARYHKKTDFLNLFPAKVGEFAELRIERAPPSRPEGLLKRTGKGVLKAVGIGGSKGTVQSEAVATGA